MKVTIVYHDLDSLTVEEVVQRAKVNYGEFVDVEIQPESTDPLDTIYFAIQQLITHEQLSLLFDDKNLYPQRLLELKSKVSILMQRELSSVIKDNEIKST